MAMAMAIDMETTPPARHIVCNDRDCNCGLRSKLETPLRLLSPPPYQTKHVRVGSLGFIERHRLRLLNLQPVLSSSRWLITLCVASAAIASWLLVGLPSHQFIIGKQDAVSQHDIQRALSQFEKSLQQCSAINTFPSKTDPTNRINNPRWNHLSGQNNPVILQNATFFDGESIDPDPVDIKFERGLITGLASTASGALTAGLDDHVEKYNVHLKFVTPGLVDMHSHHSIGAWPNAGGANDDTNDMWTEWGPMTPFLKSLDGLKAYDVAFELIASGGITSSMILPGSSNIMGGEAFAVKNARGTGPHREYVVEETLLEHGVPEERRHRYMKLACGENPKQLYHHTRMGNTWILRAHLAKARELLTEQDEYCSAALATATSTVAERYRFIARAGKFPEKIELESTVGLLRGRVAFHNHCYLPEDMETMARVTAEQGIKIKAFHHAIEAWQVPHMLKSQAENVTIATFAEFSLYKWESYFPNLAAGKILDDHGLAVAYKSDHGLPETNAKYLAYQAGVGHAFCLSEEKALQAITSVPAKAMDLEYRIGYARPGYDADLVVWDSHPLAIGATPLQVFIDGNAQLDSSRVKLSMGTTFQDAPSSGSVAPMAPPMRSEPPEAERQAFCAKAQQAKSSFVITGITKTFVDGHPALKDIPQGSVHTNTNTNNMTLVIDHGKIVCLSSSSKECSHTVARLDPNSLTTLHLRSGHILPGLTTMTASLGMTEIALDFNSGSGLVPPTRDATRPDDIDFAKHGVQLQGKAFARARMGGITRAISAPLSMGGFLRGVSVGIRTDAGLSLSDGGVFQSDVGLHVTLDSAAMVTYGTMSSSVSKLRKLIADGHESQKATVLGEVASGKLPLIIHVNNHWDIQHIIAVKKDFPSTNIVILGGSEAPLVASQLHEAKIPIILTENRPSPSEFRHRDAVVGPPLTPSVARLLKEAGVVFGVAIVPATLPADYRLHALTLEAGWTAKYAQLNDSQAVDLVSTNIEDILGLEKSRDFVIWEGNPLEFGASVALVFGDKKVSDLGGGKGSHEHFVSLISCWPQEHEN